MDRILVCREKAIFSTSAVLLLIFTSFSSIVNNVAGESTSSGNSNDWIINAGEEIIRSAEALILDGNLIIRGKLTFTNVILKINSTFDGQFGIKVEENGTFEVYDSTITAFNHSFKYRFVVYGSMIIERSNVNYMWSDLNTTPPIGGIQIYSDNVKITNSNIGYSPIGIYVEFASPIISGNTIKNNVYGIYLWHSAPTISDNIIENNTYGIYGTNVPPVIQVISPNGGEIWRGVQVIRWSAYDPDNKDVVETVTIKYSINGVTWNLIVANTPNDGEYLCNTALFPDSANYLIKIEGSDGVLVGEDKSDGTFTIDNTPPVVTIISPEPRNYQYTDGPIPINYTVFDAIDPYPEKAVFLDNISFTLDYIDVDVLSLGAHELKIIAIDDAGNVGSAIVRFTVIKEDTFIELFDVSVDYGDSVFIVAVMTEDEKPLQNKTLSFYINNNFIGAKDTDELGRAVLQYTALLSPGLYSIKAEFIGDEMFNPSIAYANLTVGKEKTSIIYFGDLSVQYSDKVVLKALLTEDNLALAGKRIEFSLNGLIVGGAYTNNRGIAEIQVSIYQIPGNYTISAIFSGDDFYSSSSDSKPFTILKEVSIINYTGDLSAQYSDFVNLSVVLKDDDFTPIANKTVKFKIGNQTAEAITNEFGIAYVKFIINQSAGIYELKVEFEGDANYSGVIITRIFEIMKEGTVLFYIGETIGEYSDKVVLSAVLLDEDVITPYYALITTSPMFTTDPISLLRSFGIKGIEGKKIKFTIDNQSVEAITNEEGIASATITLLLPAGNYLVTAIFEGDDFYSCSQDSKIFTILRETTVLKYTGDTYGEYSDDVTLSAELRDEENESIVNREIIFTLGIQKAIAKTDDSGIAKTKIKLLQKPGKYKVTAEFLGDSFYLPSSDSKNFTIEKEETITKYIGDKKGQYTDEVLFKALLTDNENEPLPDKNITFTFNTLTIKTKTNDNGIAETKITLTQIPGEYVVTALFEGDEFYNSSSDTTKFIVEKEDTILTYTGDLSGQYSDEVKLSAVLADKDSLLGINERIVSFTLGRQFGINLTNVSGYCEVFIILDQIPDKYLVYANFTGDDYFLPCSTYEEFLIEKEDTVLSYFGDTEGQYSDKVVLKAELSDFDSGKGIEGRRIVFKIGEQLIETDTDKNGIATAYLTLEQKPGNYKVIARFDGDDYYLQSKDEKNFTILKEDTILEYTGELKAQYSDIAILSAKLMDEDSGIGIANRKILFTLGIQFATAITNNEGIATFSLKIEQIPKTYLLKTEFFGDNYYLSSSDEEIFEIEKEDTVLTYIGVFEAQYSDEAELKAKLTDMDSGEGIGHKL
ncbi:MAG: Ig-like domain repeat protein, partial [Candidatus Thermoplasmatota archaeon]